MYSHSSHDLVEFDVEKAIDWFIEQASPHVARRFKVEVGAATDYLLVNPEAAAIVEGTVRRKLLDKFKYAIYYDFDGESIFIAGVFHQHRHPDVWKERL